MTPARQNPPPTVDLATAATAHVYRAVDGRELLLHWFTPVVTSATPPAAAVFFHGGGWRNGTPAKLALQCQHLAQLGVATATVQYRLLGNGADSVWDCIADAHAAMRWVRGAAARLGIDPQRIAAGGGSAGGHLALSTALVADTSAEANSCVPNLLLLFNPVIDTAPPARWAQHFAGRGAEASPLHLVRSGLPECLIMNGTADTTTPVGLAAAFTQAMHDAGNACTLASYPDVDHGFYFDLPYVWDTLDRIQQTLIRRNWIAPPEATTPTA